MIDLRSDTVTKPSASMRAAMAQAEVGDDVYAEDPTVNSLECRAAELFGKEAALFCPTGTMANTIGIKINTQHGEEVACDSRSHIIDWELSMMAWFAGCIPRPISTENGILTWDRIAPILRPQSPHNAPTTLISLENTHNMAGGTVYPLDILDEICHQAHRKGLRVHMDGARVFNASLATGVPVNRITRDCDSVMFCLSKGLGAPVGSLLLSTATKIAEARLLRKRLGGGMRQAGVLAAAGLVALENWPAVIQADHANASFLAAQLSQLEGIHVWPVATNIVIFDIARLHITAARFSEALRQRGLLANGVGATLMRMVTHCDATRSDCAKAARITTEVALACKNANDALHPVL